MLTPVEIDEVKQQVDNDTRQEYHNQKPDPDPEEQQIPPNPDISVVPKIAQTLEAIDIDPNNLIDDNDDYDKLRNEYLHLLEEVKAQPLKARQKLPKLKNDKYLKRMIKTLDNIIEETSQDDMDLTTINQQQYTVALVITNKILPPKPQGKKRHIGKPPVWQQRLQRQIDQLRGDISIITEYTKGNSTNVTR